VELEALSLRVVVGAKLVQDPMEAAAPKQVPALEEQEALMLEEAGEPAAERRLWSP